MTRVETIFPCMNAEAGDLVFFHRLPNSDESSEFSKAVVSASLLNSKIFHVAIVVNEKLIAKIGSRSSIMGTATKEILIVHATCDEGVIVQKLCDVIKDEQPDFVELCHMDVDVEWKLKAADWALNEVGAEYNDLFLNNCINSHHKRAFYCCQLASEAYKATNQGAVGESPFLPHKLNFADSSGRLIPYWVDYYRQRCPLNPDPPHGQPGTHPSILRASPCVKLLATRLINLNNAATYKASYRRYIVSKKIAEKQDMRKFIIPKDLLEALHFVNGARVNLESSYKFVVLQPRNGEILTQCNSASARQLEDIAKSSVKAQRSWARTSWGERRQILQRAADLIRTYYCDIAEWEVRDNGKSICEARADVLSCADTFEYFSGADLSGEYFPYADTQSRYAFTRREPLGVVGAIGAWNYPIQTATWKIAPAIVCGNSVIYKPSPLAPVSSVILAQLLQCSGLPDGVLNIVQGEAETGTALCLSKLISKISFTGSIQTGKAIATACAKANLKPVTLELGGKSSCIIFGDADIQMAVNGALMANFYSQGQVCSNASKVLVHRSILDDFTKQLVARTMELKVGDPFDESTHVGACISLDHLEKIENHIQGALNEGAKLLCGGERVSPNGLANGYYLSPCVLSNITSSMKIYHEEVFGAVLLIIPFDSDKEALQIANNTDTGLAAGIFTNDLKKAHSFSTNLEAGTVYINTYNDISPHVPFGGHKQSGYGRENGKAALEHYTQIKSTFVNASGQLDNPFP